MSLTKSYCFCCMKTQYIFFILTAIRKLLLYFFSNSFYENNCLNCFDKVLFLLDNSLDIKRGIKDYFHQLDLSFKIISKSILLIFNSKHKFLVHFKPFSKNRKNGNKTKSHLQDYSHFRS